jgi:SAM-dependent methyltransferase
MFVAFSLLGISMSALNPALKPPTPRPYLDAYKDGSYLKNNPTWHVEESPFKVKYILQLLGRNSLQIHSVCDAGCGVGEVLRLLQLEMSPDTDFTGFDISPQAHELSKSRENANLRFSSQILPNNAASVLISCLSSTSLNI